MRIFIIDPNLRSRETLVARVEEALRRLQLKRVAILDGTFDLILQHAHDDAPSITFFGPGSYEHLEDYVSRFRSFFPKAPLGAVLENNIYAQEALELRRFLSARIMPLADIAQMAQFILDSGSATGGDSASGGQGVVAVMQFKGGVGASSLAASLASCWANNERSVVLVDLDDTSPLITDWARVGISQRRAMGSLIAQGEVPANRVKEIVYSFQHFEGRLGVVGQPELYRESFHLKADILEDAPSGAEFITSMINVLRDEYDVVVVDAGRSWGVGTFALLPLAQHILFVCDDDETSLAQSFSNFQRFYRESDDPQEFDLAKWQFVFNGAPDEETALEELKKQIAQTDLFPKDVAVHIAPSTDTGSEWYSKGELPVTLYDLAEKDVRAAIEEIAYGLIPFRRDERISEGEGSFRARLQRLVSLLS